jgi:hypothetical protein
LTLIQKLEKSRGTLGSLAEMLVPFIKGKIGGKSKSRALCGHIPAEMPIQVGKLLKLLLSQEFVAVTGSAICVLNFLACR